MHFVYIAVAFDGCIKIGESNCPMGRLNGIARVAASNFEYVRTFEIDSYVNARTVEYYLLKITEPFKLKGEWRSANAAPVLADLKVTYDAAIKWLITNDPAYMKRHFMNVYSQKLKKTIRVRKFGKIKGRQRRTLLLD